MLAIANSGDARTLMVCAKVLTLAAMAGVYLVPRRALEVVREFVADRRRMPLGAAWLLFIASMAPTPMAIVLGMKAVPLALRCLAAEPCSASRAGGLFALAVFGMSVVVTEAAAWAARLIHRHLRA